MATDKPKLRTYMNVVSHYVYPNLSCLHEIAQNIAIEIQFFDQSSDLMKARSPKLVGENDCTSGID